MESRIHPSPVSLNGIKIQIFRSEVVHQCSSSKLKIILQQKNQLCKTIIWTKPYVFHFDLVTPFRPPPRSMPSGPDVTHARMRSEAVYLFCFKSRVCGCVSQLISSIAQHLKSRQSAWSEHTGQSVVNNRTILLKRGNFIYELTAKTVCTMFFVAFTLQSDG